MDNNELKNILKDINNGVYKILEHKDFINYLWELRKRVESLEIENIKLRRELITGGNKQRRNQK
jgi:hypothetical protein